MQRISIALHSLTRPEI